MQVNEFDLNAGIESSIVVAWNEIKYVSELRKNLGEIPHVIANGSELNQVILNILVNAAQAIGNAPREGKGVIEITTRLEHDIVILSIHDNGPGIPEEILAKIFDPFFTTKEPGKGTGLGLSISWDIIVNKHGGKIWVESEVGTGTTFYISLPVAGKTPV
jgi:signal transduction histidine kinase